MTHSIRSCPVRSPRTSGRVELWSAMSWILAVGTLCLPFEAAAQEVAVARPGLAAHIVTPAAGPEPRFNGASVFGVRPGSPILYTVAVAGQRPMTLAAEGLPEGARFDAQKGLITGTVARRGTYPVKLTAQNASGKAQRELKLVVGDTFALTPPMGCNTWGGLGPFVSEKGVRASADAIVKSGLIRHGYCFVNIDDGWQGARGGPHHAIQPNEKFGDMKKLCDNLHAMGLKVGNYSTPWRTSYAGFVGGSSDNADGTWAKLPPGAGKGWTHGTHRFEINDARQAAEWGIDYFKYDWGIDSVELATIMGEALRAQPRDIVFELSNSAPFRDAQAYTGIGTMTRTDGDLVDVWVKTQLDAGKQKWALGIRDLWLAHKKWQPFNRPGHWNMPCPLRVGMLGGWDNKPLRPSRLTVDEQFSHISLWCLWGAPIIIGAPIDKLDAFTLSLLTNDEVLDIDQDPLGLQALDIDVAGGEALVKKLADGTVAVGLFNPGEAASAVAVTWGQAGVTGKQRVRDLWRQRDLGIFDGSITATVPPHGVVLVKLTAVSAPAGSPEPAGHDLLDKMN
jgi:alpha-galactosidase